MRSRHIKQWTQFFRALANENRLNIMYLLSKKKEMPVKAISEHIDLGIKATSKHLIILESMNFLESHGKMGSVYYQFHPELRSEIKYIITKFLQH